jgi:hypothetical protein
MRFFIYRDLENLYPRLHIKQKKRNMAEIKINRKKITTMFNIDDPVAHKPRFMNEGTAESSIGILIDIEFSLRENLVRYLVSFPEGTMRCVEGELAKVEFEDNNKKPGFKYETK